MQINITIAVINFSRKTLITVMGSGVSTVTDEAGKISIEKAGEEKLINELKDVYQKNPEQYATSLGTDNFW